MKKLLVIGSLNMDFVTNVPHPLAVGETMLAQDLRLVPGGKGANQAYAMGRLGGCAAMLGAMCISGDITCLSESQWQAVDAGLHFYRRVSEVIRRGTTYRYGTEAVYYDAPVGWQAVVRRGENGETLVVFHRFGGEAPAEIVVPVPSSSIVAVYDTCGSVITAADGQLRWHPPANFSAASVLLR